MRKYLIMAFALVAFPAQAQIANTPEIATALPALGAELSPDMVGGTMKLYGPLHAAETNDGITVTADQSYGAHERNVLDVYAPQNASGAPILVFAHGGGFVRGDKAGAANIGRWFAKHGVVAVVMNYRFAPDATWPSGGEDVKGVVEWLKANAAKHGGDASKIILTGNSAGSVHVADYALRENMRAADDGVVGLVLISPPATDLEGRELDPKRDALYYGDGDRKAQSLVNAVAGSTVPVMVAYAQNEPNGIAAQTQIMVEALTKRDGRLPMISSAAGHNHISIVEHIGTADETLAPDILEFIQITAH